MDNYSGYKYAKSIVMPLRVINELEDNDITNSLFITDIGYYEEAKNHYRERNEGSPQNIILYCTEGEGWVEIRGEKQIINKDHYIIISANTPHRYGSNQNNSWSIYWIHFSGSKSNLLINHPNKKIDLKYNSHSEYTNRIALFEEIFNNLEIQYSIENLEYANICLWHLLGSFRYLSQFRVNNEFNADDKISRSIAYMNQNISNKLNLSDIAANVNLSVSQFSLLFKNKTSRSPIDYLTHLRVRKASKLLDYSSHKINEISTLVGYPDPFYFSRIFTQIMGMSPKKYRNLKKG